MKKMLVLALALVAFAGQQAHSVEGKERPEDIRARVDSESKAKAAKAGNVSGETGRVAHAIESSKVGSSLDPKTSHDLQAALKDPRLSKAADEIVKSEAANPKLDALNKARLEGIAHLGKLNPAVLNIDAELGIPEQAKEQAYAALVLGAAGEAAKWPEATQKNMIQFLQIANDSVASGKSVGESMEFAKSELKRLSKVDIKLEDIKRLCKPV